MPRHFTPGVCSQCDAPLVAGRSAKGMCRRCYQAAWYAINRQMVIDRAKAHYIAHREQAIGRSRERYQADRETLKRQMRNYHAKHRTRDNERVRMRRLTRQEEIRASDRRRWRESAERRERHHVAQATYRAKNAETLRAKHRAYHAEHPEQRREATQRHRALKRAAYVRPVSISAIYTRDSGLCQLCRKPVPRAAASMDHIVPLAAGGSHEPRNVQLAHTLCNAKRQHRGPAQLRLLD